MMKKNKYQAVVTVILWMFASESMQAGTLAMAPHAPFAAVDSRWREAPVMPCTSTKAVLYPGSLRENMQRVLHSQGWKNVVWNVDGDYLWTGTSTIYGCNLQEILDKALKNAPLQVVFYQKNCVAEIRPRVIQ